VRNVLFEAENRQGYIQGFSDNYVKIKVPWNPALVNTIHSMKLSEIGEDGVVRVA